MNVLVLGHLVLDEIHPHRGPVIESYGGIHFPVSALAALAERDDRVTPCFPVGADVHDAYEAVLRALPGIDAAAVWRVDEAATRVRLFHDAHAQYNTQLVRSLGPITFERFARLLPSSDLVYINFMTGEDLTLEAAERLRAAAAGLVYLDLHMIAYRVAQDGHRSTAPVLQWERWARTADVLQCNERELGAFVATGRDEDDKVAHLFRSAPLRLLVVTRGERGATLYTPGERIDVPAVHVGEIVDSTGCGDSFGSTLAYFLAAGADPRHAAALAARAGAFVATLPGSDGMAGLGRAVREDAA